MPKVAEKKEPKKAVKKAEKNEDSVKEYGMERSQDVPWCEKKVTLFESLKSLKALSETKAVTAKQVVEKSGETLTARDVRHYSYHAKAAGLIDVASVEGTKGHSFYLTAKGAALNPAKALAQQEKEKEQTKEKAAK